MAMAAAKRPVAAGVDDRPEGQDPADDEQRRPEDEAVDHRADQGRPALGGGGEDQQRRHRQGDGGQ